MWPRAPQSVQDVRDGDMARLYNTYTEKQWKAVLRQMSAKLGCGERGGPDGERGGLGGGSGGDRDDVSSTGSEPLYDQDIAILNRCFDDIEKFTARLQHAAAAQRELELRRRSRGGRRGTGSGAANAVESMLTLRSQPPPARDFVDVLQKFKLSFNLLARLRAHIHKPNAPELVHFLFTPLALIVDAAQDAVDGHLPARVLQPLLTRDALNLLANCVTSNETELWHSLGDAWLIPREQWKTTIPPYQPVFMDGWSPDYLASSVGSAELASAEPAAYERYEREEPDLYTEQYVPYPRNKHGMGREDSGSADDDLGEAWARGVMARGGRVLRVTNPRTAHDDKELTVVRGEYLEVLDDSHRWWKVRNRRGVTAYLPHTIVAPATSPHLYPKPIYTHYSEGGGRRSSCASSGSGGSSHTDPASRGAGGHGTYGGYVGQGPVAGRRQGDAGQGGANVAEWVDRERLGKNGEFRYF